MESKELPTVEEAIAYADGYQAGLDDAENIDGAEAISDIHLLKSKLAFSEARRCIAERERDEARARLPDLYRMELALRAIAGDASWPDGDMGFVDLARSALKPPN